MDELKMTSEWDKVFPESDSVDHDKITFHNRYGITLAADTLSAERHCEGRMPAIAVCGPFGAVKEQASGLYAQKLAETRPDLTIAFDSFLYRRKRRRCPTMWPPRTSTPRISARPSIT